MQNSVIKVIIASAVLIGLGACSDSSSESEGKGVAAKSVKVESKPEEIDNTRELEIISSGVQQAKESLGVLQQDLAGIEVLTSDVVSKMKLLSMVSRHSALHPESQLKQLDKVDAKWKEAYQNAKLPSSQIIQQVRADANYEARNTVLVSIGNPQRYNEGYQGNDSIANRTAYIETTLHAPGRLGPGDRLLPVQGYFLRDGELHGTNSYGVQITVPRYIDPPHQAADRSSLLESEYSLGFGTVLNDANYYVTELRKDIEAQRNVVLDRFVDMWMMVPDAEKRDALEVIELHDYKDRHQLKELAHELHIGEWVGPVQITNGDRKVSVVMTIKYMKHRTAERTIVVAPAEWAEIDSQYEKGSYEWTKARTTLFMLEDEYQAQGRWEAIGIFNRGRCGFMALTKRGLEFVGEGKAYGVLTRQD